MAFHEVNQLAECHHSLAWSQPPLVGSFWPASLRSQLQRRCFPELPVQKLRSHPWPEIARLATRSCRIPALTEWFRSRYDIQACNARFDEAVASVVLSGLDLTTVYGYFDTSLKTFQAAKKRGLTTVYELPTPYWRLAQREVEIERQRQGQSYWASTLPSADAFKNTAAQRDEELQLADVVVVPSTFVRESLQLAPPFKAKVHVVPYGCPEPFAGLSKPNREPRTANREPLKLLFVGTLSQTKGLADLLEAVAPLGNQIELTLAGSAQSLERSNLQVPVKRLGQLPHAELLAELANHDLLVLPTLYEGLSLSVLEALSAGLPVLTTSHSGFLDLLENGKQAILIPPRAPDELRSHLLRLSSDRDALQRLSHEGRVWANNHSWKHYRQALRDALNLTMLPTG